MEVIINHDLKDKCIKCKKEIIWGYRNGGFEPLELVSLARWDIHKCEVKTNEKS